MALKIQDSWKAMANSTRGGLEGSESQGPFLKGHFICAHPASEVWQSPVEWKWPDCLVTSQSLSSLPEMASGVLHWWSLHCLCQQLPQGHEEGPGGARAGRTEPGHQGLLPPSQPGAGQLGGWGQARMGHDRVHGRSGQHCGKLETDPAAALLRQGLMVLGGWNGVPGHGQGQGRLQRDGQGQSVSEYPHYYNTEVLLPFFYWFNSLVRSTVK